jgi:hypothetical protein
MKIRLPVALVGRLYMLKLLRRHGTLTEIITDAVRLHLARLARPDPPCVIADCPEQGEHSVFIRGHGDSHLCRGHQTDLLPGAPNP